MSLQAFNRAAQTHPLLLQGRDSTRHADGELRIFYPGDSTTEVGSCRLLSPEGIPDVIAAADAGFQAFRRTSRYERTQILHRLAGLLGEHRQPLARLMVQESGKPLKHALAEVDRAMSVCAGYAYHLEYTPVYEVYQSQGKAVRVAAEPLGPVLAITPYNFPLNLIVHKLAPAIAAGNSFTVKPASKTPLTALYLGKLVVEAGYEAISVLPCKAETAEQLVVSGGFRKLSFTGSAEAGWRLKGLAGKMPVTLELGGNAACIVESLERGAAEIATRCAQGAFWLSGQSCISVQRLFINRRLMDEFLPVFLEATRALKVGDPMQPDTDIGPMITLDDVYRTRGLIKDAIQQGANVLYGGNTYNTFTLNPTVLNRTTPEMAVNREECFAPIATVTAYETFEEALALANASRYGLQAGVYTEDPAQIEQAWRQLDVGGVIIGDIPTFRLDGMPYGGVKDSGLGREGILGGLSEMTLTKTLVTPLP